MSGSGSSETSWADEAVVVTKRPRPETDSSTRPKRQPPYAVILHNDDLNTFEFVAGVLKRVFGYATPKAIHLTMEAHLQGRSVVWSGSLEVAELKADQIRSCGGDPEMRHKGAGALGVSIEPLPGD
jgi:ATP-dependent Clp protease adaptor protein ClpS